MTARRMAVTDRARLTPVLACMLAWMIGIGLARLPVAERADLAWLDASFGLLRGRSAPPPAPASDPAQPPPPDIALVAFDEASIAASAKPFALLHDELAGVLDALRLAGARAVALDLVLPAQDYAALQPGAARRLAYALGQVRAGAPLVLGEVPGGMSGHGGPGQLYAAMAGSAGRASLLAGADSDGVLRRLAPGPGMGNLPPLASRVSALLGVRPQRGIVDYSLGAPFGYTPVRQVVALLEAGDLAALRHRFAGRVVLVGAVLPDQDRQRIPVALAAWESGGAVPGLVFQAQALRSMLHRRMIGSLPWLGDAAALALLALVWGLRRRLAAAAACAALALAASAAAALALLAHGLYLPLASIALVLATGLAWLAASALHEHRAERARIRGIFAGYVSPAILETILSGALCNGLPPQRQHLAFLFADIRGFTHLCTVTPPEGVIAFLNRYYETVTVPLHRHGGTIDKFSGDGIMVFFGAPQRSDNPARDALLAGLGMLEALRELNTQLRAEGQAPLEVGIGIAAGDAVLGNVGSASRHDYTATGAPAALAAHIQQHCKATPYALLMERAAFERARAGAAGAHAFTMLAAELDKHGCIELAGHRAPA